MEVWRDIHDSLQKYGIKRDIDVCQLYLAKKGLTSVPGLSRFHFLRHLWLNNNKIRELSCRSVNCCLTELYLHNNHIKSISGALSHLTCLRFLSLHNNQIRGLEDTMHELRKMQQLHTATFFLNPFCQEPGYRHHVIHRLLSIQVLDRREVRPEERGRSFQMYRGERHLVLQSVAFGRRAESPTRRHDPGCHLRPETRGEEGVSEAYHALLHGGLEDCQGFPTSKQEQLSELAQQPPGRRILTVTFR